MQSKINWIDNLRGIACLMVVMIHTTTWYVTNAHSISPVNWDVANILNSASRVSVPLFFMISGFLFFGEPSAQPRHFIRIVSCLLFYSAISLLYIILFTSINAERSLLNLLQKPVFYHLWFFFAIIVIYLVSPLIQVKNVNGKMLLALMVVIAVVSVWTPLGWRYVAERWFTLPNFFWFVPVPILVLALSLWIWRLSARPASHARPFILTLGLIFLGFSGLGISVWPNIIPPHISLWDAAAPPSSQVFMLPGALLIIPVILMYTAWSYYVFRGKVSGSEGYH